VTQVDDAAGRGRSIGRFLVLGPLAGGAVSAYDPELDRRVTIEPAGGARDEARALARLAHPNVRGVLELVLEGDQAYLVLEHVEGGTLRDWLAARARRWDEILDVLVAAGQGLAAAHRAGIAHRGFDLDEVLVGDDGRARVRGFDAGGGGDPGSDLRAFRSTALAAFAPARPPAWVTRALRRDWPSMDALLPALRRRDRTRAAIAVGAVALTAAVAFVAGRDRAAGAECAGAERRLAGVWDPARREAVRAAFAATGLVYAGPTWERVRAQLDDGTRRWAAMTEQTCRATRVDRTQPDAVMDLRMACLERHRGALAALTALWAGGIGADALERAGDAAARLPSIEECAGDLGPDAAGPHDPALAAHVVAARARVDAARALGLAFRPEARAAAAAARVGAEATGWAPLRAEAALVEGDILYELDDLAAETRFLEAARLARDDLLAGRALVRLARHLAEDHHSAPRSLLAADLAAAAVDRSGDRVLAIDLLRSRGAAHRIGGSLDAAWTLLAAARARAALHGHPEAAAILGEQALVAEARGLYPAARALNEASLAATVALHGEVHPRVATQLNNLAIVAWDQGDHHACAAYHRRALAIREEVNGDTAPTATTLHNLAVVVSDLGDLREAEALLQRALAIRERTLGPTHAYLASTLSVLGGLRRKQGRYDEALALHERALRIREAVFGAAGHPTLAYTHIGIGYVHFARGDFAAALPHFRAALDLREKGLGPAHRLTAYSRVELAGALAPLGRCAEVGPLLASGLAGLEAAGGIEPPERLFAFLHRGRCELAAGRAAAAVETLETAVAAGESVSMPIVDVGAARRQLALALWAAGRRASALEQARRAERELATDGDGTRERQELLAWLARHGAER
jgi:tetratricopeptide (TPR) repeat protein